MKYYDRVLTEVFPDRSHEFVNDLTFALNELICNAFRSKIDYEYRNKINKSQLTYKKGLVVRKKCTRCINVTLQIIQDKSLGKSLFVIKSYNKIAKESVNRVKKILRSSNLSEFPNTVSTDSYDSITGSSGIGIFTVNKLLKQKLGTHLYFDYDANRVMFYFMID